MDEDEIQFCLPRRLAAGFAQSLSLVTPEQEGQSAQLRAWGRNEQNALGFKKIPKELVLNAPTQVDFFKGKPVFEVACGHSHSVVLEKKPDQDGGRVWCMGLSTHGRLGISQGKVAKFNEETGGGVEDDPLAPKVENATLVPQEVELPAGTRIARVAAGADHTLALTEYGQVMSWGVGNFGNLGSGGTQDIWVPHLLRDLEDIECIQVAAGAKHSLALTSSGHVYAWGHGGNGRLGLGTDRTAALVPQSITEYESEDQAEKYIVFIECGESHSGCIDSLGRVYTWGNGGYCRTGHGQEYDACVPKQVDGLRATPCEQLSFGVLHSLALTMKGRVMAWGAGAATGLIFPGEALVAPIPRQVQAEVEAEKDPLFTQIAAGALHSVAVSSDGELFCWGQSSEGRLGLGTTEDSSATAKRADDSDAEGERLYEDRYRPKLCKVKRSGEVYGWSVPIHEHSVAGAKKHALQHKHGGAASARSDTLLQDELLGSKKNQRLPRGNAAQVECGGMFSALRTKDGILYTWGSNDYGQVGTGSTLDVPQPFQHCTFPAPVKAVACGFEHCLAISGGLLYSWGRNNFGQLGTGRGRDLAEPTLVESLIDLKCAAAGEDHSMCALTSGELYTWGNAENGKLGHGSSLVSGAQMLPRQVRLADRIVAVRCGQQHSAIVNAKAMAFAFGVGWFGRLGLGHKRNAYVPTKVDFGSNKLVESFSLGSYHSAFITTQHELYMCGRDRMVLQGDHMESPFAVEQFQGINIVHVTAGGFFSLCIDHEGGLYVFGDNSKGQLGLGRKQVRVEEPERIRHSDAFVQASCGSSHCMLLSAGGVTY
ncbi:unnamed protein product, partial [Amoebophrya sp. A120]|eukprot:GSA120T00021700001.1